MWPTAAYLRRLGVDARCFGYSTRRGGDLSRLAARLEAFLVGHEPWWSGAPTLGFVTHSMGGLIVRAWLAAHPRWVERKHVSLVMLSPPNDGSALARAHREDPRFGWLYGDAARILTDVSREDPPLPRRARVLVLAGGTGRADRGYNRRIPGDNDGLVGVAEMGLPGCDPVLVRGVHSFLQWRPTVLRRAAAFLRGADALDEATSRIASEPGGRPVARPRPGSCATAASGVVPRGGVEPPT